ncbi:MAG: peptidoglycan-associated lipoprotein Pal [Candidatus Acidiferrales bacterium]
MRIRSYGKAAILALFAIALVSIGCKHPTPTPPPTPAAPPPAPVQPTVTLQASSTMVQQGQQVTLTWSSTNATNLTIAPDVGTVAPQGTTSVSPQDSVTYTITATGPGGSADASVRITVSAPPPPVPVAPAPTIEELFNKEVQDAYFDLDKADIREDARQALANTAQFLREHPEVKVVIEGHCDERGSTEYNLVLGDRRAAAVKQFLVSAGISADRMNTVSYGKEKPFCSEHDETCWQQNRRGHFVLAK